MNKQHQSDKHWSEIFSRYLEKEFGWKYKTIFPDEEYRPDVDSILVSSENREKLFIQLTRSIEYKETYRKDKNNKGIPIFQLNMVNNIINYKENKYKKQGSDISNLILLVQECIDPDTIEYDVDFDKHRTSDFKGIYIISPDFSRDGKPQGEIVLPIKPAFTKNED